MRLSSISPEDGPYRRGKFNFTFNPKNVPASPFEETIQRTLRGGRHFGMDFLRKVGLNPECKPFVPKSARSKHTEVADVPTRFASSVNDKERLRRVNLSPDVFYCVFVSCVDYF